ncbi:GerAB/ArcD/ProY family transporter [Brevibacillus laterosporus]|uniref:GerAB/ArcD/ProY family transporter n=1 Tax=Brevibacillus laterosporus TaxID=1465 RepID=UPI0018CDC7D6|nr:endospore germination permease [Brevibacillus laterosporus]MBG9798750.1 spore gernimation protein [Brevibacillus laterosporus]MED1910494.1 endospore germination permease [Brevibacillus laterosporus]
MDYVKHNQITLYQYIFLIVGNQVGLGILYIPRDLAREVGIDGWISIVLSWIIVCIASIIITKMMARNPELTLRQSLRLYCGPIIGWIVYFLIAVHLIVFTYAIIAGSIFLTQIWVLQRISSLWLMSLFVIPIYMLCSHGFKNIARYAQFAILISVWMPLLLLFPLQYANPFYLLPIMREGLDPVIKGVMPAITFFWGFEMIMFFYPYLKDKSKATAAALIANTISMLVLLFVTIICFLFFSQEQVANYMWPTLTLLKLVEFPFLERFEVIFLSFYLFMQSISWITLSYFSVYTLESLCNAKMKSKHFLIFLGCLVVISFFYSPSFSEVRNFLELAQPLSYFVSYLFPLIFLLYLAMFQKVIQRRRER